MIKILNKSLAALCVLSSLGFASLHAQQLEPPQLTGPALILANQAQEAFTRRNYQLALQRVQEARRLRPDSKQLSALLTKTEAALAASRSAATRSEARTTRTVMPPTVAPAVEATQDPSYIAADSGYRSYERGDFPNAVTYAQRAVQLEPTRADYWLLLANALSAANRLAEADQAITQGMLKAGDDGKLASAREAIRRRSVEARSFELGTAAYKAFEAKNYTQAASDVRGALQLTPANRDYQRLLVNALFEAEQYADAELAADDALLGNENAGLIAQRGIIRKRLGKRDPARRDFEQALRTNGLPPVTEIGLLAELERNAEARKRFEEAESGGAFSGISDVEVAYLAVRVGADEKAFAAFSRADIAGKLPNTAYQDAAFTAQRTNHDAEALMYFKRSIADVDALKLPMDKQLLFRTRRAVADVSREGGVIASLAYRNAVPGIGAAGMGNDLQAGVEAYWRPWGYRNGRYGEIFARAFQTIHSRNGGTTGGQTRQSALGVRYKPFSQANIVGSVSRVFRPSGARDDWLAQVGYSGDFGSDLRVDVPEWWTTRAFAEVGRYLKAGENYALAHLEAGRSYKLGGEAGKWVLFPHVSVAADYDSTQVERSSFGIGPGVGARFWFREDVYAAPRSYLDLMLGYRARLSGAARAKGTFLTMTLSY